MSEPTYCSLVAASSSCVCEKVFTNKIASMIIFPMVYEFIIVYKIVLTCFAFKYWHIVLVYYIIKFALEPYGHTITLISDSRVGFTSS